MLNLNHIGAQQDSSEFYVREGEQPEPQSVCMADFNGQILTATQNDKEDELCLS